MSAARLLGFTAFVASAAACTSWSRLADSQPVPSGGTVQVWSAGEDILLREPKRLGDSLVGQRPLPDTTRRAVALADIDSLRTQGIDPGKMLIVGTGVAIALMLAYAEGFEGMR